MGMLISNLKQGGSLDQSRGMGMDSYDGGGSSSKLFSKIGVHLLSSKKGRQLTFS